MQSKFEILHGDNIDLLPSLKKKYSLIIIDPPFNTRKFQQRKLISVSESTTGDGRKGFGAKSYQVMDERMSSGYPDTFEDYESFLMDRVKLALPLLLDNGSIFIHLDQNEVHYIKVAMDKLMGRDHFQNEIIWSYDWGARSRSRWSRKHDTILWYSKDSKNYTWNYDAIDRIPYLAPDLVGPEKAAIGKTPTDVWFMTIVPTNSKEKTGYPTQKPLHLLNRIIKVHSNPGDWILDFFAGSGTTGEAALALGRNVTLIDQNPDAVSIIHNRLEKFNIKKTLEEELEEFLNDAPDNPNKQDRETVESFDVTIDDAVYSVVVRKNDDGFVAHVMVLNVICKSDDLHDLRFKVENTIRLWIKSKKIEYFNSERDRIVELIENSANEEDKNNLRALLRKMVQSLEDITIPSNMTLTDIVQSYSPDPIPSSTSALSDVSSSEPVSLDSSELMDVTQEIPIIETKPPPTSQQAEAFYDALNHLRTPKPMRVPPDLLSLATAHPPVAATASTLQSMKRVIPMTDGRDAIFCIGGTNEYEIHKVKIGSIIYPLKKTLHAFDEGDRIFIEELGYFEVDINLDMEEKVNVAFKTHYNKYCVPHSMIKSQRDQEIRSQLFDLLGI